MMLSATKGLMGKLWLLSPGLRLWLLVLILVNVVIPLGFFGRVEAQVTAGMFLIGFSIGVVLFKFQGFTRLLGLMHAPMIPLVIFLWTRLASAPAETPFGLWLRAVIVLDSIALVFDVADVIRYLAGDHKPVR